MIWLKTKVLEYYYIDKGAEAADFSIGIFQMKPSFIEQLEAEVGKYEGLKKEYNSVLGFKTEQSKEIRKERLDRLKDKSWQITYINCFYDMMECKYSDTTFATKEKKLQFYASAYNHGFNCSAKEINKWINIKSFPHGFGKKESKYCYAEVALYFYKQLIEKKVL